MVGSGSTGKERRAVSRGLRSVVWRSIGVSWNWTTGVVGLPSKGWMGM